MVRSIVKCGKLYKVFKWSWQELAMYMASVHPAGKSMNLSSNHDFSVLLVCKVLETLVLHKVGPCMVHESLYSSIHVCFVHPLLFVIQHCKLNTHSKERVVFLVLFFFFFWFGVLLVFLFRLFVCLFKAYNNYRNEWIFAHRAAGVFDQLKISITARTVQEFLQQATLLRWKWRWMVWLLAEGSHYVEIGRFIGRNLAEVCWSQWRCAKLQQPEDWNYNSCTG